MGDQPEDENGDVQQEPPAVMPFEVVSSPEFADRAAAEFEVDELRDGSELDGYRLSGPCPRCGHPMHFDLPLVLYRLDALDEPSTLFCRCRTIHHKDEQGCGAYWALELEA